MTVTKIKLCGITNVQDALWAVNLGADYIGLNFYSQSPRKVSPKNAKEIVSKLPPFVIPVGIFVDEQLTTITKLVKSTPLKAVQLHGQETPETCQAVKALGVQVIKVISLAGPLNVADWTNYKDVVDFFLIDNGTSDVPGGSGVTFDWAWVQTANDLGKTWFLAGGLTPDNVAQALKTTHAPAVDACSGIERLPTRKDFDAMKRFVQTVRSSK
jgi:phosphoribosylanthranilate isomerase